MTPQSHPPTDAQPSAVKTFTVVGATGSVGRVVSDLLARDGHEVRRVSRQMGVSMNDAVALGEAFVDVDGAFLMIPFDQTAPNLHVREIEMAVDLLEALLRNRVRRVVLLSGTSAHLLHRAGSGAGAGIMEELLNYTEIPERVYLRAGFFMENHAALGFADQGLAGSYATMFAPDIPTPMVAARDIGHVAAGVLAEEPLEQSQIRELLGPRDYTMTEAMGILGAALGLPELAYHQIDYEEGQRLMVQSGASESFAAAVAQTAQSFNTGAVWHQEARSARNTTPTTLETFAQEVMRPTIAGH
jgi:uncharacterized protein YbjT (DUF2867 family)